MTTIDDVLSLDRGARFYRGDLHIHSFGASHDVPDPATTPTAIVKTAHNEGLHLIAIADHNEISGVADAIKDGQQLGVLVIPAVELSTSHGHLLCYLPNLDALQRFYAKLSLADRGSSNSRCSTGMLDCLNGLRAEGGFGVLAHVDGPKGLEGELPGGSPHKKDIVCHPALLGLELKSATSDVSFADGDPDPQRRQLGKDRREALQLGESQCLARVLNSDAHGLGALGRNAAGLKKVTRYKMQSVSFEGLKLALDDADARVRIEETIPAAVPCIRAIRMAGGFLDGQQIHFGPNLNCLIGGRGTGKSTTFEAIRRLTGQPGGTAVCDSDVWPERIDLMVEDQSGQFHRLSRVKGGDVENDDDPLEGPVSFGVECYGQGETQSISQKAQVDPAALLDYLDRFIDIDSDLAAEGQLRDDLLANQSEIEKAAEVVQRIPQAERDLAFTKSQLGTLEKAKAKDLIRLHRQLERERLLRANIRAELSEIAKAANFDDIKERLDNIKAAGSESPLTVGGDEYGAIVTGVDALAATLSVSEESLTASVTALQADAETRFTTWRTKEQKTRDEIDTKRKELELQNIKLDMAYIQKLTEDEATLTERLRKLRTWEPHLQQLRKDRVGKLRDRWAARARIATKRSAFGASSSAALKAALGDLHVSLKFEESAYSPEAADIIAGAMNWRTSQVPRGAVLTEQLAVPKLLDAIQKNDAAPIKGLKTVEGTTLFSSSDAQAILDTLREPEHRYRLERAPVVDKPRLTVTRQVPGQTKPLIREFSQLSLGQQQSVLLALMLSADTNRPLIIDQPEDNLDGEFIYHTLVPVLRRAKERRQIIVVTHNANIAVLGDAEQIVVLKSNADMAKIVSRGSIDDPGTRDYACKILEGAAEAFRRRARVYGVIQ